MTPDQEQIVKDFGLETIEVFNIARGHLKTASPCTCLICRDIYDKLSQRLKYINLEGNDAVKA